MASVSSDSRGNRCIQFTTLDGKRKTLRLGKVAKSQAEAVKLRVEFILSASFSGMTLDADTAAWIGRCNEKLYAKLAACGLVEPRSVLKLAEFCEVFVSGRTDLADNTVRLLRQAARRLKDFFGTERQIRDIKPSDADAFVIHLKETTAQATTARTIKHAKQFWRAAIRAHIVADDPFTGIKPGAMDNTDRQAFVSREDIAKVIDACPDAEWRLIVALARFGGLRCPSEIYALTWPDIQWDVGRFVIRSPKTGTRIAPIFPELLPYLEACFADAPEGSLNVIRKYHGQPNLCNRFARFIERAGLVPWPKVFQNLRSTRQTELEDQFPSHVVCAWLGNSESVARKHYLQVRDEHFERARADVKADAKVTQKPTLQVLPTDDTDISK